MLSIPQQVPDHVRRGLEARPTTMVAPAAARSRFPRLFTGSEIKALQQPDEEEGALRTAEGQQGHLVQLRPHRLRRQSHGPRANIPLL